LRYALGVRRAAYGPLLLVLVLFGQAARALVRHKGRSALTMLGITIAIAAVVSVVALGRESASRYAALLEGPCAVMLQFLTEALLLSIAGGAAGFAVSVAGASPIGRVVGWSLSIPLEAVAVALFVSSSVGVFFGFVPARRAAALDPIEALRTE
jgi:putative ABC transport system permease protein